MAAAERSDQECPVCHDDFTQPKILRCAHIVCRRCVISWLNTGGNQAGCPLCCAPILPASSRGQTQSDLGSAVDALPTDLMMVAAVERRRILNSPNICVCDDSTDAKFLCLQCRIKLCNMCVKLHKKMPSTRHHFVEDLSNISDEKVIELLQISCSKHKTHTVRFYCRSHGELICMLCLVTNHRQCVDVREIEGEAKMQREEQLKRLKEKEILWEIKQQKSWKIRQLERFMEIEKKTVAEKILEDKIDVTREMLLQLRPRTLTLSLSAGEKQFLDDADPGTLATGLLVTHLKGTAGGHQLTKDLSLIQMKDNGGDQLKKDPRVTQTEDEGHQLSEDVRVTQTEDEGHQLSENVRVTQTEDEGHQLTEDVRVTPTKDEDHQLTGDSKVSQTEEAVGGHQSAKDFRVTHVEEVDDGSQLLTVDPDRLNEDISDTDSDSDKHCSYCSNFSSSCSPQSSSDGEGREHTELSSLKTKAWQHPPDLEEHDPPPPILSYSWQAKIQFNHEGDSFQRSGSDVELHVPPGAVISDSGVEVHLAVSVDIVDINHKLDLSDKEQVASPFAEFWAGRDFQFQIPVYVILPHCLPTDFDPDLVSVYHVRHCDSTNVVVVETLSQIPPELNAGAEEAPELFLHPCFQLAERHIIIFTQHFCGYVCTYCEKDVKKGRKIEYKPELFVTASGSISYPPVPAIPTSVDVSAHIWDKRIKVADFREDNGIAAGPVKRIQLLDGWKDSKLQLRLRSNLKLTYRLDCDGEPLHPGEFMSFDLLSCFGCKKCAKYGRQVPMSHEWLMKAESRLLSCMEEPCMEVSIDAIHETNTAQKRTTLPLKLQLSRTENHWKQKEHMSAVSSPSDNFPPTENTQVKQLALATASSVEASANGSASGEQSHLASTQRSDNEATSHSMSHLQEAYMDQQLAKLRLSVNPAGSGMNGTSSGSNRQSVLPGSGPSVYTNCFFKMETQHHTNIQSPKATLNCGNTYTSNDYTFPAPEDANDTLPAPPQHHQLLQPPSAVPIVEEPNQEMDSDVE